MTTLRCAIYTRKSSEEGLDQNFNSLDAQREACEAYVASQTGEGWKLAHGAYDDGGFSGGSMERPGLQALLAAIRGGEVDVVVVYKVDRLTRSLADFARIVELFDHHHVSFVSVTQAFNTTTSMGRLTLNVLLSFAQFEREVTGERIRDKIAASKAKGMWMGGRPPLGYDGLDRKLVINAAEAEVVRQIFQRYLDLGTVTALAVELRDHGVRSKRWINRRGEQAGGAVLTRGALYHLLSNPVYKGAIPHKTRVYEGAHVPIVDKVVWECVQALLAANGNAAPDSSLASESPCLQGVLYDDRGNRMGLVHTQRRGRRYRYYASAALKPAADAKPGSLSRIAVGALDSFIADRITPLLDEGWRPDLTQRERLSAAIRRVTAASTRIEALVAPGALSDRARIEGGTLSRSSDGILVTFEVRLKHRQGAVILDAPGQSSTSPTPDRALIRAVVLARSWAAKLASGEAGTVKALARAEGLCEHYTARLLPLAFLAPVLTEEILLGQQPPAVSLGALTKHPLPLNWVEQRRLFASLGSKFRTARRAA